MAAMAVETAAVDNASANAPLGLARAGRASRVNSGKHRAAKGDAAVAAMPDQPAGPATVNPARSEHREKSGHRVKTGARAMIESRAKTASLARMPIWAAYAFASRVRAAPHRVVSQTRCAPASTPCAPAIEVAKVALGATGATAAVVEEAVATLEAALRTHCAPTSAAFADPERSTFSSHPAWDAPKTKRTSVRFVFGAYQHLESGRKRKSKTPAIDTTAGVFQFTWGG